MLISIYPCPKWRRSVKIPHCGTTNTCLRRTELCVIPHCFFNGIFIFTCLLLFCLFFDIFSYISYFSVLTHLHTTVLQMQSTEYKIIYFRASQYAFLPFYATKSHALGLEQVRAAVASPPTSL